MKYDEVIKHVGEWGFYQKRFLACAIMQTLGSATTQFYSLFSLAVPRHRCALPDYPNDTFAVQNEYHESLINDTIPMKGSVYSSCFMRNHTSNNDTWQNIKCHSWVYDTSTFTSTLVTEFDLVCDDEMLQSNAIMFLFLGLLIGYSCVGGLADIIGRKPLLVICNVLFVSTWYLLIWTPNYIFFSCMRIFQGVSLSGQALLIYVIGLEISGPKERRYFGIGSFYVWTTSICCLVLFAYFIRDWFYLHISLAIFHSFILLYFLIVPESPRWLLIRGFNRKAIKIIKDIARVNNVKPDDSIFTNIKVNDHVTTVKFWKMFTSRKLCLRTFFIYFLWFGSSIIYYGIILNLNILEGYMYLNLFMVAVIETISYVVTLFTVDRIGRKKLLATSYGVAFLSLTSCIFIILYATEGLKKLLSGFAIFGMFGISVSFCVIWFYTGEMFPTELRNTGTGTSSCMARVGSIIAPYIGYMSTHITGDFGKISPFLVYSLVSVVALTVSCVLPETTRIHLPETIDDCKQLGRRKKNDQGAEPELKLMVTPEVNY